MVSLAVASKEPTPLTTMTTQPNRVNLSTRLVASETPTTLRASKSVKQYAPVSDWHRSSVKGAFFIEMQTYGFTPLRLTIFTMLKSQRIESGTSAFLPKIKCNKSE